VVNIWNTATGDIELQLNKASAVRSLAFSPDRNLLAIGLAKSGSEPSDTVWLYDVRAHSAKRSFGSNSVLALAWSPDGHWCAAGLVTALYYWRKLPRIANRSESFCLRLDCCAGVSSLWTISGLGSHG